MTDVWFFAQYYLWITTWDQGSWFTFKHICLESCAIWYFLWAQKGPNTGLREATKKVIFLVDSPLRGEGVRGCPLRKKTFFLMSFFNLFFWPLSRGAGGSKGLSGLSTKKELLFLYLRLPLNNIDAREFNYSWELFREISCIFSRVAHFSFFRDKPLLSLILKILRPIFFTLNVFSQNDKSINPIYFFFY